MPHTQRCETFVVCAARILLALNFGDLEDPVHCTLVVQRIVLVEQP
jgi:hypothetical protein